uniref:Uncharacterized protein n=1 Tax=Glossina brevipalpis TaxID=37001 RepID=A0A1A9W2A4_9MUSC
MYWSAIILIILTILLLDFVRKQRIIFYFRKHGIRGPNITLPLLGDVLQGVNSDARDQRALHFQSLDLK